MSVCISSGSCNSRAGAQRAERTPSLFPSLQLVSMRSCSRLHSPPGPQPWRLCAISLRQKTLELKTSTDQPQKARTPCVCLSKEGAGRYNFRECTRNGTLNKAVSCRPVTVPSSEPALPLKSGGSLPLRHAWAVGPGDPPAPGAPCVPKPPFLRSRCCSQTHTPRPRPLSFSALPLAHPGPSLQWERVLS